MKVAAADGSDRVVQLGQLFNIHLLGGSGISWGQTIAGIYSAAGYCSKSMEAFETEILQ